MRFAIRESIAGQDGSARVIAADDGQELGLRT